MPQPDYIFTMKLPPMQRLCHVVLQLPNGLNTYAIQVLKCRQLLYLCADVLASPRTNDRTLIDAVMHVQLYKRLLSSLCQRLDLKAIHASVVQNYVIERCVRYTLHFKLSPQWNAVADYLIHGPEFLTCCAKMEAVKLDVKIVDGEMVLLVNAHLVRLPPAELEHFRICPDALERFQNDSNFKIHEGTINLPTCHVLPTMNRAQVIAVSHNVTTDTLNRMLKGCSNLKKYWKNLYGYRLPEIDEIYCSVLVMNMNGHSFTYPLTCLRTRPIQCMPRCDAPDITRNFMASVQQKFEKLCGFSLVFTSPPSIATTLLSPASNLKPEVKQNLKIAPVPTIKGPSASKPSNFNSSFMSASSVKAPNPEMIPSSQKNELLNKNTIQCVPNVDTIKRSLPLNANGRLVPVFGKKTKTFQPPTKNKPATSGAKKKGKFDVLFQSANKGGKPKKSKHKFDSLFCSASNSTDK
uniref:uncharacterized protein C18orf63-like isoform X1 n=1 Tax=Ciona intestinalis TaxID=7719 RepID=UPI000EF4A153|nr:uncharacterized protein C18orf63-like isoform X1 [Ciona intestinalis]|eukprot:XP_026691807.1 uncharacterized protein C18orf63-like isoform X1 [Ciona intestinalis]